MYQQHEEQIECKVKRNSIKEKMLVNLEAKVKSRDHLLRELQKRDKNAAQPLRRALSLE